MRVVCWYLAMLTAVLPLAPAWAAETGRFDGTWLTAISCESSRGGRFYVLHFSSTVKDGVLHGQYGTAGEPSSLALDGRINADGTAMLHALGRTGESGYTTSGATPPGTPYAYDIDARFVGSSGTGTRTSGRACKLEIEKQ